VAGAFFEYQAGLARQWFVFDLPGVRATTPSSMLLARVAFGLYLGNASGRGPTGGELSAFYDHRHDGLEGGFKTERIGNGPQGHLGLAGLYQLTPRWGLAGDVRFGSAWLFGLSLVIRAGLR
jgi:hypothetical protein